jgi:hypothetical protein
MQPDPHERPDRKTIACPLGNSARAESILPAAAGKKFLVPASVAPKTALPHCSPRCLNIGCVLGLLDAQRLRAFEMAWQNDFNCHVKVTHLWFFESILLSDGLLNSPTNGFAAFCFIP